MNRLIRQSESLPNVSGKTALVVGAGGLGSHVASQLVRMGINVMIVDHDVLEETNLHRTAEFNVNDVGAYKAYALKKHLDGIDSKTIIGKYNMTFSEFLRDCDPTLFSPDIIIDCSDNLEVRYEIDEFAKEKNIPWIYGAINGKSGMFMFFPKDGLRFSEVFGKLNTPKTNSAVTKVFPPGVAIVASLQVAEAVKYLNGDIVNQTLYAVNLDTYAIQSQLEF